MKQSATPAMRMAISPPRDESGFYRETNRRVSAWFREKNIRRTANAFMIAKLILILALFFGLYVLILSGGFHWPVLLCLAVAFGIASTLVGFNIGHDAAHGSLFRSQRLNQIFSYTFELIGMSSYAWKLKHNVVHHGFPNTPGVDFDIEAGPILRLSPSEPLRPWHRWQHLYAPFAYMLFSLSLVFFDDFSMVLLTRRETIDGKPHPVREKIFLVLSKAVYLFLLLFLPALILGLAWWQVLAGFLIMHFCLSIILAFVLIPAHLFEQTQFPARKPDGQTEMTWAAHQVIATIDYARESRLANFLFGGLNTNVVHHLFPGICHVHLIPVSRIIKETAQEYGVTYHETSLWRAMVSHLRMLKKLGTNEAFKV